MQSHVEINELNNYAAMKSSEKMSRNIYEKHHVINSPNIGGKSHNISPYNSHNSKIQSDTEYSKNIIHYKKHSPPPTHIVMPGGDYYINNEDVDERKSSYYSHHSHTSKKSYKSYNSEKKSSRHINTSYSIDSESSLSHSSKSRKLKKDKHRDKYREKEREKEREKDIIFNLMVKDFYERKKQEDAAKQSKQIPSSRTPNFKIPENEPVDVKKSKRPNYETFSDEDKQKVIEKFRNNYNMLRNSYPKWDIQSPDFTTIPLGLIHEQYEEVVRTICIYQTAMKWKVYLVILIAAIEYYGYKIKKYMFLKGLLKTQIKTIHKFDVHLIEFASQFYTGDNGDDDSYPTWMRFLYTLVSSVVSFSSINGAAKAFGSDTNAPDFIFEQADKFVSPPEGTAKLHSDGISEVPEPPTGYQDPNNIINMIGSFFSSFSGGFGSNQTAKEPTSVPQAATAKPVDDFEDADF